MNQTIVYRLAVYFYMLSWLLRGIMDPTDEISSYWGYPAILLIAFLTAFFRLSYNKRFFDNARRVDSSEYLLAKSYQSQLGLAIFFTLIACMLMVFSVEPYQLNWVYLLIAPVTFLYLGYQSVQEVSAQNGAAICE